MSAEHHHDEQTIEAKKEKLRSLRRALVVVRQNKQLRDLPYKMARERNSEFIGMAPLDHSDESIRSLIGAISVLENELGKDA